MNKYIKATLLVSAVYMLSLSPVFADNTDQYGTSVYGTTQTTEITLNKQVKNPITGSYVDGLSANDATFSPEGEVYFKLSVHNTTSDRLNGVLVKDIFPSYLTFKSIESGGPAGNYDSASKTLTMTLDLAADETRDIVIKAQVDGSGVFPKGQSTFCVDNIAKATLSDGSHEKNDTAGLCIQTNVLGTTTLPSAGVTDILPMLPFIGTGLSGLYLIFKRK